MSEDPLQAMLARALEALRVLDERLRVLEERVEGDARAESFEPVETEHAFAGQPSSRDASNRPA